MSALSRPVVARALLFGGTLGVASAANAAFSFSTAYVKLQAGAVYATAYDTSVLGSGISAVGANSLLALSAFSSNGFTLSAASDGSEVWSVYGSTYGFTVDEATTVVLSGNIDAASGSVYLVDNNTSTAIFLRGAGSGAWSSGEITLAAGGSYTIGVNGPFTFANGGTETGVVLDFAVVPAPGAAALLGLAGLIGSRRRR